jgi:hypothetical protein
LRLVDAELDAGTKLDATKVTSAELIGSSDLDYAELTRNTRLAGSSRVQSIATTRACRRRGARQQTRDSLMAACTELSDSTRGAQKAGGVEP